MDIELVKECSEYIMSNDFERKTGADAEILAFHFFRNIKGYSPKDSGSFVQTMAISNL